MKLKLTLALTICTLLGIISSQALGLVNEEFSSSESQITIHNGFSKTNSLYNYNSRAKSLLVYLK